MNYTLQSEKDRYDDLLRRVSPILPSLNEAQQAKVRRLASTAWIELSSDAPNLVEVRDTVNELEKFVNPLVSGQPAPAAPAPTGGGTPAPAVPSAPAPSSPTAPASTPTPAPVADDSVAPAWFDSAMRPLVAQTTSNTAAIDDHEVRISALENSSSVGGLNFKVGGIVAAVLAVLLVILQVGAGTTIGVAVVFALVASTFVGLIVAAVASRRRNRDQS